MSVITEISNAFDLEYQSASNTAPDMTLYEKSYFLTAALKKLITEAIPLFDINETSRRLLQPLLVSNKVLQTVEIISEYQGLNKFAIGLPKDCKNVLREVVLSDNCPVVKNVEVDRLDQIAETINNPFKKPNKRKVLKIVGGPAEDLINLGFINADTLKGYDLYYSTGGILEVRVTYFKYENPIILGDLQDDPNGYGDETIGGLFSPSEPELYEEFIPQIISIAVVMAIASLRNNTIETKSQI